VKVNKRLLFIMVFSAVIFSGCGLKGGLYLPEESNTEMSSPPEGDAVGSGEQSVTQDGK